PVNMTTGSPSISVPIWELKGKSLSLPISLSYRPGVKIADVSEYTGHGWSLLAGGVITRKKIGTEDLDARIRDYNNTPYTYDELDDVVIAGSNTDPSPDLFNYNFNGKAGQFVFKNDLQTPYFIKEIHDWQIIPSPNLSQLTIITEDGTTYIFAEQGKTTMEEAEGTMNHDFVTSWHLTEIISPTVDEKIVFTYYTEGLGAPRVKNNRLALNEGLRVAESYPEGNLVLDFTTKRISTITLYIDNVATHKVTFEKESTPRDDAPQSYALDKIKIYQHASDPTPIKYFDLETGSEIGERLYLHSIQEFSGDGLMSKPPYVFEYHEPWNLPLRQSYKADHWGYYSAHGTEFPFLKNFKWRTAHTKEASFPEAQAGSLKSITFPTGGKQELTYELNEYHELDYDYYTDELQLDWTVNQWINAANNQPATTISKVINLPSTQDVEIDLCLEIIKAAGYSYNTLQNELATYEVKIINNANNQTVFSAYYDPTGDPDQIDMLVSVAGIGYVGPDGNPTSYAYDSFEATHTSTFGTCLYKYIYLNLAAGSYTMQIHASSTDNNMSDLSKVSLQVTHHSANMANQTIQGAGIRIANQKLRDSDGSLQKNVNYSYVIHDAQGNPTNKSSGQITEKPVSGYPLPIGVVKSSYWDDNTYTCVTDNDFVPLDGLIARTGRIIQHCVMCQCPPPFIAEVAQERFVLFSQDPAEQISWVMYTEVREEEIGNGFTIHKFHGMDNYDGYYMVPVEIHKPAQGNGDWGSSTSNGPNGTRFGFPGNGNLILTGLWDKPVQVRIYSNENYQDGTPGPVLLREENFEYYEMEQPKQYSIAAGGMLRTIVYGLSYFPYKIGYLKGKETKTYTNTSTSLFLTNRNDYDYGILYLPSTQTTYDSEGKEIMTEWEYAADFSGTSFGSHWLRAQGSNGKLIRQTQKVDNVTISKTEITYAQVGNLVLPSFIRVYPDGGTDYVQMDMEYDQTGNLLETKREGNIPSSYIWGYHQKYPVAEIIGASHAEIVTAFGGAIPNLGAGGLSSAQEQTLRNWFATNRPWVQITTYTYDFLIGMTASKDPREKVTSYEYDKLNRLK
ncbi:MAG: hypothetical protein AAFU33_26720, partial [Bacteroidota bacterium]